MTSPRPGPRRARLAPLLAALALAAPLAAAPVDPAVAADEPTAQVTLTRADVTATSVTLTGMVTNTGTVPLTDIRVALWRSPDLLLSPEAVAGAVTAGTTTPGTARVVEETNRDRLGDDPAQEVPPGATLPFTVSGTREALGLVHASATWWAGVDATARAGGRALQPVGSARTLVSASETPLPVATVVELSAPPRQVKKDLFIDDGLHTEVDGGRLDALLDAVEGSGTTWVVDPSLLAELEDMADGYRIRTADGTEAGTGADAAAAWLGRLRALPTGSGAVELFGSPDLPALAALPDEVLRTAVSAETDANAPDGLARVAVLDRPDASGLALAAQLGGHVVLLDSGNPHVHVRAGEVDALVASEETPLVPSSALLPDTALNRAAVRLALARAAGGELRWADSPEAIPADTTALPPGLVPATLADLAALPAHDWAPPPAQTPAIGALDAGGLGRVLELRDRMAAYAAAAPASGVGEYVDAQTARAASRWWTGEADAQSAWLTSVEQRVALPQGDLVTLDASPRFTMTGRTSEFPVTVTNRIQDPITVRVVASTDNPQRIRLLSPDPVEIPSGSASTVLVPAESAGGGVVSARVHVETADGHRLTPDREIAVETTNVGTIGWVIVIASGLVLVVTTAHRIRQVRRQGKGEDG